MLGMMHVISRDGLVDQDFIDNRTEGYDAAEELCRLYSPEAVEEITGVPAADLEEAARLYAEAENGSFIWGLGVTEHKYGSEVVQLICNVAMMTGKVGRPGSALLPLRGQNNVQGSSDMGALPDTYTAYRSVGDEDVAQSFEHGLGRGSPPREGLHHPADVRRRRRRPASRRCTSSARTSPRPIPTPSTWWRRSRRSTSWSSRRSSRTRPPSSPT